MIVGSYPCCDEPLMKAIAEGRLPVMEKESCPHCGKTVWHWHSRINPASYTQEQFDKEFEFVDNVIKIKSNVF